MEQSMYGVSVPTLRRYEFNKGPEVINMEALIEELARIQMSPELSLID